MVRNKGRGSGLLRTPDVLRKLLEVGCTIMGEGRFSLKTRLGVDRADELLHLMPLLNEFPLRHMAIHARTARQMYEGECDVAAFRNILAASRLPIVYNGDARLSDASAYGNVHDIMVGRGFVRSLGEGIGAKERLERYIAASVEELCGERPVLGRIKELVSYWKDIPAWHRRWQVVKLARSLAELEIAIRD
jgi:tRNA-dihydrouridine synthase